MNSSRRRRHMDNTPTERTPLLASSHSNPSVPPQHADAASLTDGLPHVGPFVAEMRPEDLPKYSIDNLYPPTLRSRPTQIAFSLCALLYFRKYLRETSLRGRDVWAQWRQEHLNTAGVQGADSLLVQVWEHFLAEEGSSEDVRDVLWSAYPLYPDSKQLIRVVDFLASGDVPTQLLNHPLIHGSAVDAWKYGLLEGADNEGILSRLLHFLDSTGTPRALHLIDLLFHFSFLGVLCNYLLDPPIRGGFAASDSRGILLSSYAFSRLFQVWSSATLPFFLVLISFLASLPSTPFPETFAYTLLLVAFSWNILLLHLPVHPSPLFLLSPEHFLPLAVLVWRGLARTFIPTVAFFTPGLFISLVLLSISLSDTFLLSSPVALAFMPSPLDSRVVFLGLLIILFMFLCCALGFSVLVHPFLVPHEDPARSSWDRYSNSVGLEARQVYVRALRTYATPRYFPAPLNILHVLLVRIPGAGLILAGRQATPRWLELVENVLWRTVMAPSAFVVSTLWLWNLRTKW
ncbi:hypothetical protein LXA43DRAFT_982166 [Ganoderma leucocontextum]|nr:hypothetical protein LXA43DRAFT_982166 [Ganoderma leucocontextum]